MRGLWLTKTLNLPAKTQNLKKQLQKKIPLFKAFSPKLKGLKTLSKNNM